MRNASVSVSLKQSLQSVRKHVPLVCVTAINFTFIFHLQNQPNVCNMHSAGLNSSLEYYYTYLAWNRVFRFLSFRHRGFNLGDQLDIYISALNQPNACKHALCWPLQLLGTRTGLFGKELVRSRDITSPSLTFHEESNPLWEVSELKKLTAHWRRSMPTDFIAHLSRWNLEL